MIEVSRLSFRFPKASQPFFENLNLSVPAGRNTALTGPSGIGKTTFLQILAGLMPFQEGTVKVAGTDLGQASDAVLSRLRNQRLGFIFQDYNLVEDLTVQENLELRLSIAGRSATVGLIAQSLARVGLTPFRHVRAASLSGGQKQRLAAARAVITRPQWILADEPTVSLDDQSAAYLIELLFSASSGATVVVATHDQRVLAKVDRCIAFETLRGDSRETL